MFANVSHFHLWLIFGVKSWTQPLKLNPVRGSLWQALALPANSRLVCKWLTVATILAYCDTAKFLAVKSFIVQAQGRAISNGREPQSCLGRVFNSKLGRIGSYCMVSAYHITGIFYSWKLMSAKVCPCKGKFTALPTNINVVYETVERIKYLMKDS